eukprot:942249-Pyramimonas_sp.AAC.1
MADHTVRGDKRRGIIIDPGAAEGLGGTETLREICQALLWPRGKSLEVKPSAAKLSGIDGVPNPSMGLGKLPLNLTALPNASFTMDMPGGSGSRCPLLMPLDTMINNTMGLLT